MQNTALEYCDGKGIIALSLRTIRGVRPRELTTPQRQAQPSACTLRRVSLLSNLFMPADASGIFAKQRGDAAGQTQQRVPHLICEQRRLSWDVSRWHVLDAKDGHAVSSWRLHAFDKRQRRPLGG